MNSLLHNYRVFDICISCEMELPGLSRCDGESPDWTITCPEGELDDGAYRWFHTWTSPQGQDLMSAARHGENYLLRIFGLLVFRILFGERRIEAYKLQDCPPATLAHLLLDQVLPRVLCHEGRAVIHASGVRLQDGRVLAFTGPSGRGKSTLATAFHNAGHQVLADDCLLLEQRGTSIHTISAYSSLRLWPDTLAALARESDLENGRVLDMAHYSGKKQILFANEGDPEVQAPGLSALLLLDEPRQDTDIPGEDVRIQATTGSAAVMAMIQAGFVLDVVRKEAVQRNFRTMGQVANHAPVYSLSYPRDFTRLPQLIEKIMKFRPG